MKSSILQERKNREKQARIQTILAAALKVFSSQGYHGTSMDAVAEAAELGKATLYYYFKSKDELLLAILENGVHEFFASLEERWKGLTDPIEKLETIPYVGADFFYRHPDYFKLYHYLTAHPVLRKRAFNRLHPLIAEKVQRVQQLFTQAIAEKRIEPLPVEELTEIFGSLVMGMGLFTHPPVTRKSLHRKAQLILHIFLNGIRKQSE